MVKSKFLLASLTFTDSRLLLEIRQVPAYTISVRSRVHANFGEAWRTLANPQRHIRENLPRICQSSGEGPPPSPEFGFCMGVAFRMCPNPPLSLGVDTLMTSWEAPVSSRLWVGFQLLFVISSLIINPQ